MYHICKRNVSIYMAREALGGTPPHCQSVIREDRFIRLNEAPW